MRDARSASLSILRPASTTALLVPVPELMLGRREGIDSLVSAGASPGGGDKLGKGGRAERPLVAVLAGDSLELKTPPELPGAGLLLAARWWSCHASCAEAAVHRQSRVPGVAAQLVAPSPQLCSVQAGTTAEANRRPRGPGSGSRSVLCWPLGLSWPPALVSPQRLAAAARSSVLPHGPWPQIRRGAGLAAAPVGAGCQAGGKRLQGGQQRGRGAPCQQPLRVANWLRGQGWWPPVSSTMTPGCGTGVAQGGQGATSHPRGALGPNSLPRGRQELRRTRATELAATGAPGDTAAQ